MKQKLENIDRLTWEQVFSYYFPEWTHKEVDHFLWEGTCFPFDTITTHNQIYEHYLKEGID